jgi:hypothetical protein
MISTQGTGTETDANHRPPQRALDPAYEMSCNSIKDQREAHDQIIEERHHVNGINVILSQDHGQ